MILIVIFCNNQFIFSILAIKFSPALMEISCVLHESFFQEYRVSIGQLASYRFCLYPHTILILMRDAIGMSQNPCKYILNALTVSKHLYMHINSIMFILMYQSLAQEELERMEVSIKSVSQGYPR